LSTAWIFKLDDNLDYPDTISTIISGEII